jgi:hypothetical protein
VLHNDIETAHSSSASSPSTAFSAAVLPLPVIFVVKRYSADWRVTNSNNYRTIETIHAESSR